MDRVVLPESISAGPKLPVDKTFRPFNPDQVLLLPPSLDDWLPAEHLARFVAELVDEHLDLTPRPSPDNPEPEAAADAENTHAHELATMRALDPTHQSRSRKIEALARCVRARGRP